MGTRLFAAVVPPADAVEHLEAFLEPRRDAADFRWTLSTQFHVTLAFLPDVVDHLADEYVDRLAEGLERTPIPDLRLAGPVVFPDAAATRVLAVGVAPVSEAADVVLERMAGRARNAAVRVGTTVDGQRFRPHLTVARLRHPADTSNWVRLLETYSGPEWPVYEVAVIASHLGEGAAGRPRYEVLAEIPIGG
ncbi:RNA 2',3'-cyclic phosphodiesterase [Nocardioides sp. GY 10113]|uniref:RNA 2',3'-cyclic phosphodiesterase n=1 Tax=Nocardioides sp. GY 10113 TaxID=2569761 RepID=UPI0010A8631E|nr:RNA 2',3'-cyclic phosphodiesterase [Nocardioides sp. GY 10113]TIC85020.1 RNA 2',3'-cyclic phosphodiesterase [Nocardioides sp. GY 10113]